MNEIDPQDIASKSYSEEWKSWSPEFFLTILLPELRTPILAIKGYAEILSDEKRKEHHPQALDRISKNLESLEKLCEAIAEYRNELQSRHST